MIFYVAFLVLVLMSHYIGDVFLVKKLYKISKPPKLKNLLIKQLLYSLPFFLIFGVMGIDNFLIFPWIFTIIFSNFIFDLIFLNVLYLDMCEENENKVVMTSYKCQIVKIIFILLSTNIIF
jgi:hypothetical protein